MPSRAVQQQPRPPAATRERVARNAGPGDPSAADRQFKSEWQTWHSTELQPIFSRCRKWSETTPVPFIRGVVQLKAAFLDHGRRLRAREPQQQAAVDAWLQERLPDTRITGDRVVTQFLSDVLQEWVRLDNVVVSWWEDSLRPYLLRPEACSYANSGGHELLTFEHGLDSSKIREFVKEFGGAAGEELRKRLEKGIIRIEDPVWNAQHPALADYFTVATRQALGHGFITPALAGLQAALSEYRSLELGEASLAYAGRKVNRQHLSGYPIKSGDNAATTATHAPKGWPAAVKSAHGDKVGYYETATNFDQTQVIHWLDVEKLDPKKWESVLLRAVHWAGPIGSLLLGKGTQLGDLWQLFTTECVHDRSRLQPVLEEVLTEFIGVPVTLAWGTDCFTNPRVMAELLKQGYSAGAVSNQTFCDKLNLDFNQEVMRKQAEVALEQQNPGTLRPIYDAAHGEQSKPGGRPEGTPDP